MKKGIKWIGIIFSALIILLLIAAVLLSFTGRSRLSLTYDNVQAEAIPIPLEDTAPARGEHLVDVYCRECHTADLSGQLFVEEPPMFSIHAANITGVADSHSDEELVLAIRHGLRQDRTPLIIMPSEQFINLSQEDLAAIIAYLKTIPRTGKSLPAPQLMSMGSVLAGLGAFDSSIPATYIEHDKPFPDMPQIGANAQYGQYLSGMCISCHGEDLTGGPSIIPDSPPAPNLTPGGNLGGWTEVDFFMAMRSGMTPDDRELDPEFMPWPSFGRYDDQELTALWLYLNALPAAAETVE